MRAVRIAGKCPGPKIRRFCLLLLAVILSVAAERSPLLADEIPFTLPPKAELLKLRSAIVYTEAGEIHFRLFPGEAPWHVANFKYLADKGFYRGLTFHLLKPGYIIQGGDPLGTGFGGPAYSLPGEFSERKHLFGVLGMARRPDRVSAGGNIVNPERRSSSSQFHVLLGKAPHLDGRYTIFGEITEGEEVLRSLDQGSKIDDVRVFVHPDPTDRGPRDSEPRDYGQRNNDRRNNERRDQRSGDSR